MRGRARALRIVAVGGDPAPHTWRAAMRMRVPAVPARDTGRTAGSEGDASDNALGEYLRRCRARLDPSSAGLPVVAPDRRVEGLRREEISFLTGVSADYYGRLEQGRERNPSVRVVEALSRALQLDPDGRGRLYRLSGINPSLGPDSMPARVHPALLRLLEDSSPAVAYALSPCLDVTAVSGGRKLCCLPWAVNRTWSGPCSPIRRRVRSSPNGPSPLPPPCTRCAATHSGAPTTSTSRTWSPRCPPGQRISTVCGRAARRLISTARTAPSSIPMPGAWNSRTRLSAGPQPRGSSCWSERPRPEAAAPRPSPI